MTRPQCIECYGTLVAVGTTRKNGKKHADWDERRLHKKCYVPFRKQMMPILNCIYDTRPIPITRRTPNGLEHTVYVTEAEKMFKTMLNNYESKDEMLEWLESTALYENKESRKLSDLFDKQYFMRITDNEREVWYNILDQCED
jgi:hypothetical protein